MKWTVAFLFSPDFEDVLLVEKTSGPEGVKGFWNGIGGKTEKGETPTACILREVTEEVRVHAGTHYAMRHIGSIHIAKSDGSENVCTMFSGVMSSRSTVALVPFTNDAGEQLRWFSMDELYGTKFTGCCDNLRWWIPIAWAAWNHNEVTQDLIAKTTERRP